jgi:alkylation response protein AidB-like acyl-CoA dehydrogenase
VDFRSEPEADAFRAEVRALLDAHNGPGSKHVGVRHNWDLHRAMAERGWIAASWPKEYGGQERDPFELAALKDEIRRRGGNEGLVSTMMIADTLRHVGNDEQKLEVLPRILAGEALVAMGYSEPDSGSDVAAAKTRAVRDGDEWVINGQKMFTSLAEEAAYVFLLTRTNTDVPKHQGLTMFLVPLDLPGIEIRAIETLGGERTNVTFYNDVRVPDSARVGDVDGGWTVMTVAMTFERDVGAGWVTRVLERALAWAATSPGADGRPIIEDPLARERLAAIAIDSEVSKLLSSRTTWIASQDGLPGVEGSMTKLFCSEAFQRATGELLDLMGPYGALQPGADEAPADGWIEHDYRFATVTTIFGGTNEIQRSIIAERHLGLPRSRPSH